MANGKTWKRMENNGYKVRIFRSKEEMENGIE